MKRLCDLNKIAFAVVICPTELQWRPALRKKLMRKLNKTNDDFDFLLPNRILTQELNRFGIEYLDLAEFYSRGYQNNTKSFNKPNDPHWNLYGNKVGAELVGPWLTRLMARERAGRTQN